MSQGKLKLDSKTLQPKQHSSGSKLRHIKNKTRHLDKMYLGS